MMNAGMLKFQVLQLLIFAIEDIFVICYPSVAESLKSSSAGNLELIAPISGELLNCSLCGDVCFYEYLYQLDKAHFNLKSIQAAEPDNAEYYLEGDDYLMYLPEYKEPVALLYLDTQNTFVNVYGVFVDEKLRGKGIGTCLMSIFLKTTLTLLHFHSYLM